MTVLYDSALLAGRGLRRFLRSPQLLGDAFGFPLILLVTLMVIFGEVVSGATGEPYIARLAPAIVLFGTAYACVGTGIGYHADVRTGFLDRLYTMPLARPALLAGRLLGDLARLLTVAVVTVAAAYLFGFRFTAGIWAALAFFGVVMAFAWMFLWLALVVALRARSEQAVSGALTSPITLLLLLSSGLVPPEAFPPAAQPVIRLNPMSSTHEVLMGLSAGGPVAAPLVISALWFAAATALLVPLALRSLRRRA